MLIFFAKYTLYMCIFLNFGANRNCNIKLNDASTSQGVYANAACIAKCVVRDKDKNFPRCNEFCKANSTSKDNRTVLRKINANHDLILVCRDDRSLTLKVVLPNIPIPIKNNNDSHLHPLTNRQNTTNSIKEIYVIYLGQAHDPIQTEVYLSNEHFITIDNLLQNTTYNISVVAVDSTDEYSIISNGRQFTTLRRGYKPKEIPEISLLKFDEDETDETRVTALISWSPSYDLTCHYDLIYYSPAREDMEVTPIEIRNPKALFSYTLDNLTFATEYNVGIRAKNTNDSSKESDFHWKMITTPTCLEWHNYNFNICAPLKPEGLFVEEHFIDGNEFSLNISWQHPKYEPDYYTLKVLDLDQLRTYNVKPYVVNVTRDQNWVYLLKVTLKGMMFEAHLTAYTPGGNSSSVITKPTTIPISDKNQVLKLVIAILAPILCITILSLVVFIVCHRRAKLKRYQERCKYFEELEKKAPIDPKSTFDFPTKTLSVPPSQDDLHQFQLDLEEKLFFNDEMEINRSDVTLYEVLGEGAFGLVRRGIFYDGKHVGDGDIHREVAVKMLKDQPSVDDVRAFRREIEVMKSVGRHANIVGIIGHCTRKYNEMLLLTEYCSFGNLLNFLRNEWKYLHELSFRTTGDPLILPEPPQKPYPLMEKNHRKLGDSVFNFDATILEKIKLKYKHINSLSSNASTAYVGSPDACSGGDGVGQLSALSPPAVPELSGHPKHTQPMGKFNKSYGYHEMCTNACKCRVDILSRNNENPTDDTKSNTCGQIKISSICDCKLKKRRNLLSMNNESYYTNLSKTTTTTMPTGKQLTEERVLNGSISAKREPLKATDLLDIAKQVAMGMEFLSKNKVVHRDLAARNVLVSSDRTVKIADFGLSRDVYQENVYKKTGNGKLPIKWLAVESMTHQVYTSQSDVWSYGILLYEIATLGGIPYPSIPTNRLLHLLKTGYRMERPKNCGQGFYNLMSSCWQSNPVERPNFTEIIKILDSLMCDSPQLQIEKPIIPRLRNSPDTPTSDDSYLKPL